MHGLVLRVLLYLSQTIEPWVHPQSFNDLRFFNGKEESHV